MNSQTVYGLSNLQVLPYCVILWACSAKADAERVNDVATERARSLREGFGIGGGNTRGYAFTGA
jgi:hypothetical protein